LELLTHPLQAAIWSADQRRGGRRTGFVPTMGALHAGHLALVSAARKHCDRVVASIFVNPLQFNDQQDLERYPRRPEEDRQMLLEAGCDMVFMPDAGELYENFLPIAYDLNGLDKVMEGASRPGHFRGVVNVVERLFHYVRPDLAIFGEKDRQQLAVIQHVASARHWPVRIIPHPIVRAQDGLALSSRNQRLSPEQRQIAPLLHQALQAVRAAAFRLNVEDSRHAGLRVLAGAEEIQLDYLTIAHPENLRPLASWEGTDRAVAFIAAQLGPVRLIDNIELVR
jgi:pantoate--beta-alanine ligase